jgi:hypothetical protein
MHSIFPLLQAAATFSREYTGAWACSAPALALVWL